MQNYPWFGIAKQDQKRRSQREQAPLAHHRCILQKFKVGSNFLFCSILLKFEVYSIFSAMIFLNIIIWNLNKYIIIYIYILGRPTTLTESRAPFGNWKGPCASFATVPDHFGYPGSPFPEYAVWPRHSRVCSVRSRVSRPGPGGKLKGPFFINGCNFLPNTCSSPIVANCSSLVRIIMLLRVRVNAFAVCPFSAGTGTFVVWKEQSLDQTWFQKSICNASKIAVENGWYNFFVFFFRSFGVLMRRTLIGLIFNLPDRTDF